MRKSENRTVIQTAAERLRAIVLDAEEGALIGSEDALVNRLGCARATVRQVARLLEREGLLRVKRGINGGYFGARPDAGTIEATVSAYLETLHMDPQDVTILASALWILAMRKAAQADPAAAGKVVERLRAQLARLSPKADFETVRRLEQAIQAEIFELGNSGYIKLVFDINVAFSRRSFSPAIEDDDSAEHLEFVDKWRDAKLMELKAIASGDSDLAAMAAQYSRQFWHRRVYRRHPPQAAATGA